MTRAIVLAAVILLAAPVVAPAQDGESSVQRDDTQRSTQRGNTSVKQGIKSTAREIKQGVKGGAAKVRRGTAVAQCNDGRYSYTHHRTCNHHGGVRKRFR